MCKQKPKWELWSWDSHSGEQYCFSWHWLHLVTFSTGGDDDSGCRQKEQKRGGSIKVRECREALILSINPRQNCLQCFNSSVCCFSRTDIHACDVESEVRSLETNGAICNYLSVTSVSWAVHSSQPRFAETETTGELGVTMTYNYRLRFVDWWFDWRQNLCRPHHHVLNFSDATRVLYTGSTYRSM